MQLKGDMPLRILFKVGFMVKIVTEGNQARDSNNPYKFLKCA